MNYWPELSYDAFQSTSHLLHMLTQALGKLKLATPFEPQWANVPLWITSRGLTTGAIPHELDTFMIDLDLHLHEVILSSTRGQTLHFKLESTSVAKLVTQLLHSVKTLGFSVEINMKPQEIPDPIPFDQDTRERVYDPKLAFAWWRILVSSTIVLKRYHARFNGKTQPIGFMWGTFDLRDVRYSGQLVDASNKGYLKRNSMNAAQIECGWWSGSSGYKKPAYYSFTFPEPKDIANVKILPKAARWDANIRLFLLDYDDIRQSNTPSEDLFAFFESAYQAGAKLANWNKELELPGNPI